MEVITHTLCICLSNCDGDSPDRMKEREGWREGGREGGGEREGGCGGGGGEEREEGEEGGREGGGVEAERENRTHHEWNRASYGHQNPSKNK